MPTDLKQCFAVPFPAEWKMFNLSARIFDKSFNKLPKHFHAGNLPAYFSVNNVAVNTEVTL